MEVISVSVAVLAAMSVFVNPDFEDSSKHGVQNKCVEIGRFGYNGNGGVKISPGKRYVYVAPLKDGVRFEKGRRYVFGADIRKNGGCTGQIAVEAFDKKTGKYAHGFWGSKLTRLDGGWIHCDSEFVPKAEPEEVDYHFIVYAALDRNSKLPEGDPENYVCADNLSVADAAPVWEFGVVWPTHFKVFSEKGRVRVCSNFIGPFFGKDAKPTYEMTLVKPDGAALARATVENPKAEAFTAEFGRLAYEGPATLVTVLKDGAAVRATNRLDLTVAPTYKPKKGEVFVAEDGRAFVDGKPFMPIGFYSNFADRRKYKSVEQALEQMKEMRSMGFDTIMDYHTYSLNTPAARAAFYGACEKAGLRVLVDDFSHESVKTLPDPEGDRRKRLRELIGYPAVIGFYTMDEGNPERIPALIAVRRILNAEAPGHIVNTCNIFSPYTFLMTADIAGGDKYPIEAGENRDMASMEEYCRKLESTTMCGWHAPQCFNWADYNRDARDSAELYDKLGREPMENEMLSVALLYASYGVKGFLFYAWFNLPRGPFPEREAPRKERAKNVAKALRDMEPFIMSGVPYRPLAHKDLKGSHRVVAWSDGKGGWRVTVVGIRCDNECEFTLPPEYGQLKSRCGLTKFENGKWVFKGREFSCDILE